MKTDWAAGDQVDAADLNDNFKEAQHHDKHMFFPYIESGSSAFSTQACGASDATPKLLSFNVYDGGVSDNYVFTFQADPDWPGAILYFDDDYDGSATSTVSCGMHIGTDSWTADNNGTAGNRIQKNGTNVTISGTTPSASPMLGHDPTNAYLLVLDSTTRIRRYSGIAGTTITYVDDITLDTAIDNDVGFFFDDTNNYYVCINRTSNVVRRFNSSGTTVDTTSYTCDDTWLKGICIIGERYYLMFLAESQGVGGRMMMSLKPIDLTR